MICHNCGGGLTRKNRAVLLVSGIGCLSAMGLAVRFPAALGATIPQTAIGKGPAIMLAGVGLYLILWATLGKGLWCRRCKTFPLS